MQPYLTYGWGIRSKNLPAEEKERLEYNVGGDIFNGFAEESTSNNDDGVFYLITDGPWTRKEEGKDDLPWCNDLISINEASVKLKVGLEDKIKELGLEGYRDNIEFLISTIEV